MTKKPFSGIHAALLSGFADDGGFDERRQRNITAAVLRQRIDGIYVGGSSAESPLMTPTELARQQEVVAEVAAETGGGKTLIAHVGQPNTRDSIMLARHARDCGYHALSALPPASFAYSVETVADHYKAVAQAGALPLIVYEFPMRTGRATPFEQLEILLSVDGVIGMKFTSPDLFLLQRVQKRFPDKLFFFGIDEMFAAAAMLGVDGGIGTTYNLIGGLYSAIAAAIDAGDLATARRLQWLSQDLVDHLLKVGVMPGTKHLMQLAGIDCGPSRLPLRLGAEEHVAAMERWFAEGHLKEFIA
jgi:N-acetylneuraminate lyase